jgi:hypothetical protein
MISGPLGRQRALVDVVRASVDESCRHYGFDMDPVLRSMIADNLSRTLIRAYTNATISGHGFVLVPTMYAPEANDPVAAAV